jgi:hypothetical protein
MTVFTSNPLRMLRSNAFAAQNVFPWRDWF